MSKQKRGSENYTSLLSDQEKQNIIERRVIIERMIKRINAVPDLTGLFLMEKALEEAL